MYTVLYTRYCIHGTVYTVLYTHTGGSPGTSTVVNTVQTHVSYILRQMFSDTYRKVLAHYVGHMCLDPIGPHGTRTVAVLCCCATVLYTRYCIHGTVYTVLYTRSTATRRGKMVKMKSAQIRFLTTLPCPQHHCGSANCFWAPDDAYL